MGSEVPSPAPQALDSTFFPLHRVPFWIRIHQLLLQQGPDLFGFCSHRLWVPEEAGLAGLEAFSDKLT